MPVWKRLTTVSGEPIDVNLDQVCFMVQHDDCTSLHFPAAKADAFKVRRVKEKMEEIHMASPMRSLTAQPRGRPGKDKGS